MKHHILSEQVHPVIPESIWCDRYAFCGRPIRKADISAMQGYPLCKVCARAFAVTRLAEWQEIVEAVVDTYSDEGVALWIAHYKGDRAAMLVEAQTLCGQVAS